MLGRIARFLLAMIFLLYAGTLLLSCSSGPVGSASPDAGAEAAPPDAVQVEGVIYSFKGNGQDDKVATGDVDRQTVVDEVEVQLSRYDLQDGQATYLEPGTPLYAVQGYDPSFRLAARVDRNGGNSDGWLLYEVAANPDAQSATELLDVRGKVERVSLEVFGTAEQTVAGERVNSVLGSEEAKRITNATLDAPLRRVSGAHFNVYLTFHLKDGTRSSLAYDPGSGELYLTSRYEKRDGEISFTGVVLPEEYRELLRPSFQN